MKKDELRNILKGKQEELSKLQKQPTHWKKGTNQTQNAIKMHRDHCPNTTTHGRAGSIFGKHGGIITDEEAKTLILQKHNNSAAGTAEIPECRKTQTDCRHWKAVGEVCGFFTEAGIG